MIKKNNEKSLKEMAEKSFSVWLLTNKMESYHPEYQLVYYKFLKDLLLWHTKSTSGIRIMQEPPFYCKWFLSVDNSVQRLLLLKIVLHSLFADDIDGLRPNSAYADAFWCISGWNICIKRPYFHSGRNSFKSEVNTWVYIGSAYQGIFVATWEC